MVSGQEIAIAKIEASWASNLGGNWVKPATRIIEETNDGPVFTNYPELWTAVCGLTAEQRKQVFADGVRGYTDNEGGIQELANGNSADAGSNVPPYVAAERQADTSSGPAGSEVVAVSGSTDGAPRRAGKRGSRNVGGSKGRDAASSRVNLLELGRILTDAGIAIREKRGSAQQIGQSLSASALIPLNAVGITPAQVSEIVALDVMSRLSEPTHDPDRLAEDLDAIGGSMKRPIKMSFSGLHLAFSAADRLIERCRALDVGALHPLSQCSFRQV